MRTHTSPWDYTRNYSLAPYDATCPECGHPCYKSALPEGETMYNCPKCGESRVEAKVKKEKK